MLPFPTLLFPVFSVPVFSGESLFPLLDPWLENTLLQSMLGEGMESEAPRLLAIPVALLLLGALFFFAWGQPHPSQALSRWSCLLPTGSETPEAFYARLYQALGETFVAQPLPLRRVSFGPRPLFATRTVLGGRPLYLQIRYSHLSYYIYVCPAPGGLFISSWLFSRYSLWEQNVLLRWLVLGVLAWLHRGLTLFGYDCIEIFETVTHQTLLDVIEAVSFEEGLPPLPTLATRPVRQSFYAALQQGAPLPQFQPLPEPPLRRESPPSRENSPGREPPPRRVRVARTASEETPAIPLAPVQASTDDEVSGRDEAGGNKTRKRARRQEPGVRLPRFYTHPSDEATQ